ncbi:MAG: hypothetical protein LBK29_02635 [Oscillospiraceae bacterium]|jgi:hypothetical protein|nr:hypothetical protein [Oscillospiraceae bacterium]
MNLTNKKNQRYLSITLIVLTALSSIKNTEVKGGGLDAEMGKGGLDSAKTRKTLIKKEKCIPIEKLGFVVFGSLFPYVAFITLRRLNILFTPDVVSDTDYDNFIKFLTGEEVKWKQKRVYSSLNEFIRDNDTNLEGFHNYVQLVFPNELRGMANGDLCVNYDVFRNLSKEKLKEIQENARPCFLRMVRFWGFEFNADGGFTGHPEKQSFKNHNSLRVTRVLKWLWIIGQFDLYKKFLEALEKYYPQCSSLKSHWRNAARKTKSLFEVPSEYENYVN